jgi:hypothetical protein
MRRLGVMGIVVIAIAGCSSGVHRASTLRTPSAATHAVGLAPGTCTEPPYGTILPEGDVTADHPARVGISIERGNGDYVIDDIRVEVLPPTARVSQGPGETDPFASAHEDALKSVTGTSVEATDTSYTVVFDGRDSAGASLPAGTYPVVFSLTAHARPGGACEGPPSRSEGVLTTIDWQG